MSEYDAIPAVDKIWLVLSDLQQHSDAVRENADRHQREARLRRMLTLADELTGNIREALGENQQQIGGAV